MCSMISQEHWEIELLGCYYFKLKKSLHFFPSGLNTSRQSIYYVIATFKPPKKAVRSSNYALIRQNN